MHARRRLANRTPRPSGTSVPRRPAQTSGGTAAFAIQAQAHAATNSLWVSFAMAAQHSAAAASGTIAPDGRWAAQCPRDGHPAVAIADIDNRPESIGIAVAQARPWRRLARAGAYDARLVTDDRSDDRGAFKQVAYDARWSPTTVATTAAPSSKWLMTPAGHRRP